MSAPVTQLPLKRDTLSSQVTRYLLDLIASQALRPGDFVPSEVEICRSLNVSRGIVREAYRSLATLGILEIESGKRPKVQRPNASVLQQLIEFELRTAHLTVAQVLQLRRAIEIEMARLAAEQGTEEQFERLRKLVDEMHQAQGDHERIIAADVAFHTTLAEATGNPLFALMIAGLRGPLEGSMAHGLGSRRTREEVLQVPELHRNIVQRICARDGRGAGKAMALHFDVAVAAILAAGCTDGAATAKGAVSNRQRASRGKI